MFSVLLCVPVFNMSAVLNMFHTYSDLLFKHTNRTKVILQSPKRTQAELNLRLYLDVPLPDVQQHAHTNLIMQLCPLLCCLNALLPHSSAIFMSCCIRLCRGNSPYRSNAETTAFLLITIQSMLQLNLGAACSCQFRGHHGHWFT